MSVAALTTVRESAPESMQASSSPERLPLPFRVSFEMSFIKDSWMDLSHSKVIYIFFIEIDFPSHLLMSLF